MAKENPPGKDGHFPAATIDCRRVDDSMTGSSGWKVEGKVGGKLEDGFQGWDVLRTMTRWHGDMTHISNFNHLELRNICFKGFSASVLFWNVCFTLLICFRTPVWFKVLWWIRISATLRCLSQSRMGRGEVQRWDPTTFSVSIKVDWISWRSTYTGDMGTTFSKGMKHGW